MVDSFWAYFIIAAILLLFGIKNLRRVYGEGIADVHDRRLRLINGWLFSALGVLFAVLGAFRLFDQLGIPLF